MATPTLEIREGLLGELAPWYPAAFITSVERLANPDHPLAEEITSSSPTTVKLALELVVLVGISIRLTFTGLYHWLSGPPVTARQRDQLRISAVDRYLKYRYFG